MEETSEFRIQPLIGIESYLLDDNGDVIARINGVMLQKAFALKDGLRLLLLTGHTPEDGMHLVLLDRSQTVLEQIDLYPASTAELLANLTVSSDTSLQFQADENTSLTVEVEPEGFLNPTVSLPLHGSSNRGRLSKHYLRVQLQGRSSQDPPE